MTSQVTHPPADPAPQPWAATFARTADLLIRLEAAAPRPVRLVPIADLTPASDGSGDVFAWATVYVDAGDGLGAAPHALHEIRLAAACLAEDPPFPAAPSLAPRLLAAAAQAAAACLNLHRSLD